MTDSPCHGCEKRKTRCHAGCPDYAKWAKEHEAEKEELRRKKREYHAVATYFKEARERAKK